MMDQENSNFVTVLIVIATLAITCFILILIYFVSNISNIQYKKTQEDQIYTNRQGWFFTEYLKAGFGVELGIAFANLLIGIVIFIFLAVLGALTNGFHYHFF